MSDPIYAYGSATITPPLSPDAVLTLPDSDWIVDEDGATLRFTEETEGSAYSYDGDLAEMVEAIAAFGSIVNGSFEWAVDETEFGRTVIRDNTITEYAGFRAYTDGSTEDGRAFTFVTKEG
jgi:hypothetical protein